MSFVCKYCGKEFDNGQKLGGHTNVCKLNPNYDKHIIQLENARKSFKEKYKYINQHLHCQYCNKEVGNKGCLVLHEKYCINNPNHLISKKQLEKIERDSRRDENGKLKYKSHKHTEETKKILSEKRKQWLKDHKDEHVWKRHSKFVSEPCENLKQYLKDKGINFVEEYEPFNDVNYCVDIAWPDEKIAIEINGNQHYNRDGSLCKYYQERHNLFENRGWKVFEIHYSKCFDINLNDFNDILKLPIYDKDYVGKYFSKKEIRNNQKLELEKIRKEQQEIKNRQKQEIEENHKQIIFNLINNSGIDFTKSGWSKKATEYLLNRNEMFNKVIFRMIRKYYPDFLKREDVWKRKGSIY